MDDEIKQYKSRNGNGLLNKHTLLNVEIISADANQIKCNCLFGNRSDNYRVNIYSNCGYGKKSIQCFEPEEFWLDQIDCEDIMRVNIKRAVALYYAVQSREAVEQNVAEWINTANICIPKSPYKGCFRDSPCQYRVEATLNKPINALESTKSERKRIAVFNRAFEPVGHFHKSLLAFIDERQKFCKLNGLNEKVIAQLCHPAEELLRIYGNELDRIAIKINIHINSEIDEWIRLGFIDDDIKSYTLKMVSVSIASVPGDFVIEMYSSDANPEFSIAATLRAPTNAENETFTLEVSTFFFKTNGQGRIATTLFRENECQTLDELKCYKIMVRAALGCFVSQYILCDRKQLIKRDLLQININPDSVYDIVECDSATTKSVKKQISFTTTTLGE